MDLGRVVDYCIEYNSQFGEEGEPARETSVRDATQADWDAFFG